MGGIVSGVTNAIFGSPQQAAAPDYAAAAKETAAGNLQAAEYATTANRANQYNPYGSVTWQKGATENDPWTQTTSFSPQGQALFDLQQGTDLAYGQAAQKGFDNIKGLFENPNIDSSSWQNVQGIDLNKLPGGPINAGQTAQQALMSRLRPTLDTEQSALDTKLANQGISLGSDAYKRAMNLQGQRMNDLELQAASQGIGLDMANRQQSLAEQQAALTGNLNLRGSQANETYAAKQNPLNLINALKSGSQVQAPQFGSYAQQATTSGPDLSGAAKNQYGASWDIANFNNNERDKTMQTTAQIAGMFSDRRVKENIKLVGKTDGGLNIYTYNYIWGGPTQMGVMAQELEEVNPSAVGEIDGVKIVDYSKVV